jgi:chloramphenicol-sensitive protein RarD
MTAPRAWVCAVIDRLGLAYGVLAFSMWGVLPLYWRLLHAVPPFTVLAHRVVWTAVATTLVLAVRGSLGELRALASTRRTALTGLATTVLIASNWYVFIWGIGQGRTIECSLGYFVSPLVSVLLGTVFLGERVNAAQGLALLSASVGVAALMRAYGAFPWLGLALAGTFGVYGLLRKMVRFTSLPGLAFESLALTPLALFVLPQIPSEARTLAHAALLVGAGVVTALPLLWFNEAARRLPLTVVGLLQYLSPTGQFLVGALVFHEPFSREKLVAFAFVWVGLAVFTGDALRQWHASRRAPAA